MVRIGLATFFQKKSQKSRKKVAKKSQDHKNKLKKRRPYQNLTIIDGRKTDFFSPSVIIFYHFLSFFIIFYHFQ
jgi:hypothetical protein